MCRQDLSEVGGKLLCVLTNDKLQAIHEALAVPNLSSEESMMSYVSHGVQASPFSWTKIFNDPGAVVNADRGRYQCELSQQRVRRSDREKRLRDILVHIHDAHLSHLGKPWDHAILLSSTQSPYLTPSNRVKARQPVHAQKRHRDVANDLELPTGELVAPGAYIVLLAVMPHTALDVYVPSRKCLVRIPIPIGHALVLPANTVHRGIGFMDKGKGKDPKLALHIRLHWYVTRHELVIPDGFLNEKTDWELCGENIPTRLDTIDHTSES